MLHDRSDRRHSGKLSLFARLRTPASGRRSATSRRRRRVLAIERLEPLLMLHADIGGDFHDHDHGVDGLHVFEAIDLQFAGGEGGGEGGGGAPSGIPALQSLAGAAQSLYLDFDGHFDAVWGSFSNVVTPVFDKDGNSVAFSSSEVATIQEIWARVAEDYVPFKINVTTVDPGDFSNGKALRVAIGGDGSWIGPYGGVAYVNTFTNSIVNTAYAFSKNLGNGHAKYVAEAVSHEAGHAFGLQHQSSYNASGQKTAEYNAGNSNWAPIMGVGYYSARSTWHNGQTTSATTYQDDLAVISRSANVFGYRPDDAGDTTFNAKPVTVAGNQISASGIVGRMTDADYFSFGTAGGPVSISLSVAALGPNLDSTLELRNTSGNIVATASPSNSLGAAISTTLAAGQYFLVARSTGAYGSVGQYTIAGTVPAMASGGGGGGSTTLSLTVSDVSLVEGNSGNRFAYFTVRLSAASAGSVSVQYATANGTALSSTDYYSASGSLYFAAGQTSAQVGVYVRGDIALEANENFYLDLRNAAGAAIADSRGEATILNDDGGSFLSARSLAFGSAFLADAVAAEAPGRAPANAVGLGTAAPVADRLFTLLGELERSCAIAPLSTRPAMAAAPIGARVEPAADLLAPSTPAANDAAFAMWDSMLLAGARQSVAPPSTSAHFDWLNDQALSMNWQPNRMEALVAAPTR